jgi:hypothetical protein
LVLVVVSGCTNPLDLLKGGTNVAANTQLGQENNQTVGTSSATDLSVSRSDVENLEQSTGDNKVKADVVEKVVVNEASNNDAWLILAFAIALFLDSPTRWPGQIWSAIRGKNG